MTAEPKLLPLRIRLPYATEEEFIAKYGANVARGGLFIATRSPRPQGTGLSFELVLADGGRLLRGEGVVVKQQSDGPRPGMTVRFARLDAHSKALIDRIMLQRGPVPSPGEPPPPRPEPTPVAAPETLPAPHTAPVSEPAPEPPPTPEPAPEPTPEPALELAPEPAPPPAPPPPPSEPSVRRSRPVISAEALRRQAARPPLAVPATVAPAPPPAPVPTPAVEPPPAPAPAPAPVPAQPPPAALAPEPVREEPVRAEVAPPRPETPVAPAPEYLPPAEPRPRRRTQIELPTAPPTAVAPPEVVLGIDLGTTRARLAIHHQGTLRLIPLGGAQTMSSLVCVDETGQLLVGVAARAEAERAPQRALLGLRRFLGRRARSSLVRALGAPLPFPLITGPQGDASVALQSRDLRLTELTARLLSELKSAAVSFLGHEATRAVLCVPAYFDDRQRAAMREAGTLAGLEVLRILNSPSAAALAFGHGRGLARKRLLVVELGGGGLDVSVVQLTGDDLEVITTGGDPTVGGMDFDARIAEALVSARQELGLPRPEQPSEWVPLLTAAETVKVALSEREEHTLPLPGTATLFSLNRERLEALTADLVQRLTLVVRQVLESSALTPQGLDEVLLVGGQGRSPLVRRRLEESLGVPVRSDEEAPHFAALGAALLGQGLLDAAAGKPGATVSEVLSVPLGVAERGGTLRRVFERNTRLPAEKTLVLPVTPGPLLLTLFQGTSPAALENEYLGLLALSLERAGEVEVHFSLSQDGTLSLEATLPTTVKRQPVQLATDMPEEAELETLLSRSPLEGDPGNRSGGLLSGLRKLFGRR